MLPELNWGWMVLFGPRSVSQRQGLLGPIHTVKPQERGLTTSSLYITSNAQMNDQTWGSPRSSTGATTSIGPHEQLSDQEHHTGNVGSRETAATHARQGDDGPYPGYPATSHDARRMATTSTPTDVQPTPAVEQCTMSNINGGDEQHTATMNNAARYAGTDIDPIILSPKEDCRQCAT